MNIDELFERLGYLPMASDFFWQLHDTTTDNLVLVSWQSILAAADESRTPESEYNLDDFSLAHDVPGLEVSFAEVAQRAFLLDMHRQVIPAILSWCQGGRTVLEVGSGDGLLLCALTALLGDVDVLGLDRLKSAVDHSSRLLSRLGLEGVLLTRDLGGLEPRYDHYFDRIILRNVQGNDFSTYCDQDQYVSRIRVLLADALRRLSAEGSVWFSLNLGASCYLLEDLDPCIEQAAEEVMLHVTAKKPFMYGCDGEIFQHHCWLLSRKARA